MNEKHILELPETENTYSEWHECNVGKEDNDI